MSKQEWGKRLSEAIHKVWCVFFDPCPTLFDVCVCFGFIGIVYVNPSLRGFYLVTYSILLMAIGFNYPERRKFNGGSLAILCVMGFTTMFFHSYYVNVKSITFQYLNFYLMMEGLLYILFTCILFYTVTTKSKNIRLLLFTLPFCLKLWIPKIIFHGQFTPVMSLCLAVFIYMVIKKKWSTATLMAAVALVILGTHKDWALMKFACRPHIWGELIEFIKNPPFLGGYLPVQIRDHWLACFVGSGFNKLLVPDNLLIVSTWGNTWLFRHNDFLSLAAYIGVLSLIPICMFIRELAVAFRRSKALIFLMAACFLSFFQITFIHPDRVIFILLMLSWMYIEHSTQREAE